MHIKWMTSDLLRKKIIYACILHQDTYICKKRLKENKEAIYFNILIIGDIISISELNNWFKYKIRK